MMTIQQIITQLQSLISDGVAFDTPVVMDMTMFASIDGVEQPPEYVSVDWLYHDTIRNQVVIDSD